MPRDVTCADAVAVGDGGQPLDVRPEQPGEDLGLGLAQLRELLGDVGDRAVVLAQLLAGPVGAVAPRRRSRRLTGPGPAPRPCPPGRRAASTIAPVALLQLADPAPGERGDRLVPAALGEEAQRAGGQVVVGLVEGVAAASVSTNTLAGRPRPRCP